MHRELLGRRTVRIKPIRIRGQSKNYKHPPAIVFLNTQILNLEVVNHGIAGVRKDGYYALKSFSKSLVDAQIEAAEARLGIWSGEYGQHPFVKSRKSEIVHNPYCKIRFRISKQNYTEIEPNIDLSQSSFIPCNICKPGGPKARSKSDFISIAKLFSPLFLVLAAALFLTHIQTERKPKQIKAQKHRRHRKNSSYGIDAPQYIVLLNSRLKSYFATRRIDFCVRQLATSFPLIEEKFIHIFHRVLVGLSTREYEGSCISLTFQYKDNVALAELVVSNLHKIPHGFDKLKEYSLTPSLSPTINLSIVPENQI